MRRAVNSIHPALPKMIRGQSRQAGDVSPKIWLPEYRAVEKDVKK